MARNEKYLELGTVRHVHLSRSLPQSSMMEKKKYSLQDFLSVGSTSSKAEEHFDNKRREGTP